MSFVHLHLHSEYSLLDGAIQFDALTQRACELQMPAVALTDHGNLFGALEFYLAAKKAGIKPIIGCEVYLAPGSRFDRTQRSQRDAITTHLVLLAQNLTGYRNLCRLVTAGFFEGFYYKPRLDFEILQQYQEGIIALSGCIRGDIPSNLKRGKRDLAYAQARQLSEIFPERFYIELQRNGCAEMEQVSASLIEMARELNLPLVATNDCHYMNQEDAQAHDVLLCIQAGKTVEDENRLRFEGDELYFKSPEEMRKLFDDLPEACENTLRIAESCNLELTLHTYHFPKFEPPKGITLDEEMAKKAHAGLEKRLGLILEGKTEQEKAEKRKIYTERLEREIKTIQPMGFAGYFLIVADFVNYARSQNIPVGPGRGSAAGSLVAYSLGITDLDPLPYGLLFERFLNPERISMPDIDMDFCIRGRDQVIRYVQERYGPRDGEKENAPGFHHQVAQIITFGKMQAKAVIRDVGRALNMPYGEVDRIAKMVPTVLNITLEQALEQEPKLKALVSEEAQVGRLMDLAMKLEGLVRHASIHAAGVVMTDGPLVDHLPLYRGTEGEVVTQFDMNYVEKMGLIKFDFLGLRTLTVLDDAVKMIHARGNPHFDLNRIPLDDTKVYEQLSTGDTLGIFQLESSGMRDLIARLKPNTFEDLIALVALYRPGPLGSGMVDDFIKRKHGRARLEYPLPQLEPILKDTYGIILYQEQVMQIAAVLGNYSLGEADLLRRAMGKKKAEEMAQQKDRFLRGATENKIPQKEAEALFELMAKFAEYGFNKSHSAAYALIAYQTAYLKTHFPREFMASLLNSEKENTDKIFTYMHDCRSHNIRILPPDVNESDREFAVTADHQIRFGLSAVKNVGEGAVEAVIESRKLGGVFLDFSDFCSRVDLRRVNRRVCESLVTCGAFDFSPESRATLMASLDRLLEMGQKSQTERVTGQGNIFSMLEGKSHQKQVALPQAIPWEPLHQLMLEKKSLGFFITGHPLNFYPEILKRFANTTSQSLRALKEKEEARLGGVVNSYKKRTNRRGSAFAYVNFEDMDGVVDLLLFSSVYEKAAALLDSEQPLFVRGNVDLGEESVKIIATDLMLMEEVASKLASKLEIRLPAATFRPDQLDALKTLITQHKGNCPTYIRLVNQHPAAAVSTLDEKNWELLLSLPSEFKMDPTPLALNALQQEFGCEVICLL